MRVCVQVRVREPLLRSGKEGKGEREAESERRGDRARKSGRECVCKRGKKENMGEGVRGNGREGKENKREREREWAGRRERAHAEERAGG